MKLFLLSLLAICAVAGCDKRPRSTANDTTPNEQEIERRVQERLADERRIDAEQRLKDREQQVATREAALAERESARQPLPPEQLADERVVDPEPAAATSSYDVFYKALDTDGDWIETGNYGYVWRPHVAVRDANWRPYTRGHWAETDDGWTWISDEPFGWATYHYGRWTRLRGIGWAWVPGDDWAPAWVSWRYSDAYVGWAPLPPEAQSDTYGDTVDASYGLGAVQYVFVPVPEFCAPSIQQVIFAPQQNITIFARTVNVTNITVKNRRVINRGPRLDAIKRLSRHPVNQLTLEKVTGSDVKAANPVVAGNRLQVVAPAIRRGNAKPEKVKATVANVQPESSPGTVQRAPDTAKQTATPMAIARPTAAPQPAASVAVPVAQQPARGPLQPGALNDGQQRQPQQRQAELLRQRAEATRRSTPEDAAATPDLTIREHPNPAGPQQQQQILLRQQQQAAAQIRERELQATEQLRARQAQQIQQQRGAAAERVVRQPDREFQPPRTGPLQPVAPVVEQPKRRPTQPAVSVPSVSP